jgi:hypothetical protein
MSAQRKRFSVHDDSLEGIDFKDGKTYRTNGRFLTTTDARLSAEPGEFNPNLFGKNWIGILKSQLEDLPTGARKVALDSLRASLDSYEQGIGTSEMGSGHAGSFSTGQQHYGTRPEKEFGSTTDAESINEANKRFYATDRTQDAPLHRDDPVARQCADINKANREFYGAVEPTRLGRAYGKG